MFRLKGIIMIISGSMLWGATGPILEWILETTNWSVPFLLTIRLIVPGLFILTILFSMKKDIFSVWKTAFWRNQLFIFGVFGMLGVQYSFIATIDASNAVVATLLQFSAPIFITLYVSLTHKKFPPQYQIVGIAGILVGLFLLLTNGSIDSLMVGQKALLWGLALGVTFAFYTLYPANLMREWNILIVVGWAMLIGGVVLGVINRVWSSNAWSILLLPNVALMLSLLLFFGTIAFTLFLNSMKYISAVETSILSSVEPLTAMAISIVWFGTMLKSIQLIGAILMLIFVTQLSIGGNKKTVKLKNMEKGA